MRITIPASDAEPPAGALVPVASVGDLVPHRLVPAASTPALVYLARLAPGSRRTMRTALETIARVASSGQVGHVDFPWEGLRYQHTQAVRAVLAERLSPASVNKHLAAMRGVLKEAWRLGLIDAESYRRAADLERVRASVLPAGREVSRGELLALFATCKAGAPSNARDAALLAILYGGGLRRSEAVALDLKDYSPETGALTVRAGKGRKDRVAYATNGSRAALDAWLAVRGNEPGPLLHPVNKGGRVIPRRMTAQAVLYVVHARAARAGIAHFSPHDLRRTFISHLLDAGADISTVQQLAGHANVTTTARYDRRGEAAKRKAAELLCVPFVAGGTTP